MSPDGLEDEGERKALSSYEKKDLSEESVSNQD